MLRKHNLATPGYDLPRVLEKEQVVPGTFRKSVSAMTQVSQNHVKPDHKAVIEQAANEICRRGFRAPALAMLEGGPLIPFLGSQLLWVAQPALSLFMPSHKIRQAAKLLETPEAMSSLTECLRVSNDTRNS